MVYLYPLVFFYLGKRYFKVYFNLRVILHDQNDTKYRDWGPLNVIIFFL